ncbi:MAG: FxsA family protein [Magnetococcales bacterium]|nr:FxsA family protein [Magnetococcales bacterium]
MNQFSVLAFVVLPFIEIWLLIWAGRTIGVGNVFLSLLASALFGIYLIRHEGMKTLATIQDRLQRGEIPGKQLLDGAMLLVAGILLILPGYLSDLAGLILLFPWTRTPLHHWFLSILEGKIRAAAFRGDPAGMIIEGETLPKDKNEY